MVLFLITLCIHGKKTSIFEKALTNFLILSTNQPITNDKEQSKHKNNKKKQNKDTITLYSSSKWIKSITNFHCSTTPIKQTVYSKFLLLSHLLLRGVGLFQMKVIQGDTKITTNSPHPASAIFDNTFLTIPPNEIRDKHKNKTMRESYFFIFRRLKNNVTCLLISNTRVRFDSK